MGYKALNFKTQIITTIPRETSEGNSDYYLFFFHLSHFQLGMERVLSVCLRLCAVRWHLADCKDRFIPHRENQLKYDTSLSRLSPPAFHRVKRRQNC